MLKTGHVANDQYVADWVSITVLFFITIWRCTYIGVYKE